MHDPKDTITMDVPLMIRLFELMREEIKTDPDLHHVVERILDLKNEGVLTMNHYSQIARQQEDELNKVKRLSGI